MKDTKQVIRNLNLSREQLQNILEEFGYNYGGRQGDYPALFAEVVKFTSGNPLAWRVLNKY